MTRQAFRYVLDLFAFVLYAHTRPTEKGMANYLRELDNAHK